MDHMTFLINDWEWTLHSFTGSLLRSWLEFPTKMKKKKNKGKKRKGKKEKKSTLIPHITKSHHADRTLQVSCCGSFK